MISHEEKKYFYCMSRNSPVLNPIKTEYNFASLKL